MAVKEVTYYLVECDEPDCSTVTADLGGEYSAWSDGGAALDEWINSDGIAMKDGRTFCDEHAAAHRCADCCEPADDCQCDPTAEASDG